MDEIFRCIEGEDRVSDYASSQLANIRRRITRTNEKIRDQLNNLILLTTVSKVSTGTHCNY